MMPAVHPESKEALNKRLEAIGWGLFLIIIGALWIIPDELASRSAHPASPRSLVAGQASTADRCIARAGRADDAITPISKVAA
jgi:hypothetical protein